MVRHTLKILQQMLHMRHVFVNSYIMIIYINQVKQESPLTPSKDNSKMRCILEALQV